MSCTVVVDTDVADVEVTDSTSSTDDSACSIGSVSCCSTSSGDEPGSTATTTAVGICRDGMSSCLREPRLNQPNTAMATVTSATTERLARDSRARRDTVPPEARRRAGGDVDGTRHVEGTAGAVTGTCLANGGAGRRVPDAATWSASHPDPSARPDRRPARG